MAVRKICKQKRSRHETCEGRSSCGPRETAENRLTLAHLRHEGACRLLADGLDIRIIQLMLGHADVKQTQRYLNITGEQFRKSMIGAWERRRQLRTVGE